MKFLFSSLCLLLTVVLSGQNTYHTIVEINPAQRWLRSTAAAEADAATRLLIYQHGGASINLSGGNIGQVNSLNGAGHYDLNKVIRSSGDTLFLAFPVTQTYALSKTQLVVFQSWEEVSVTGVQTVSQPFNGTTGGVIFLAAERSISLEAGSMLSANGAGFRGANGQQSASDCSRLTVADGEIYALSNWRGSPRGEGVAGVPAGQESGRAPAANGGGGGNDHNAGGGGGGNSGAGGIGARNIVMGLFNNACRGNYPGRGGQGLATDAERLYFGGGGGAGHANNTTQANGGNGGGIIVLWAPVVQFAEGSELQANGSPGVDVSGDGGGGGGAGGSLLLLADTLLGAPSITLAGGKGGDVTNFTDRCFGPGGGGGGGRLLTAAANRTAYMPQVNTDSGGNGLRLGSNECGPNDEPAGSGNVGIDQNILIPVPSGGFVQLRDTLCGGEQLLLTDASLGAQSAQWEIVPASAAVTAAQLGLSLRITFADSAAGTFQAIQSLISASGEVYPGDTATFTVFPSASYLIAEIDFQDEFVAFSLTGARGYDSIRYDFGDGTVIDTNVVNLSHTYAEGGDYTVSVTLLNASCGDVVAATENIFVPEFASAEIDLKDVDGCAPLTFDIADISTGTYTDRRWNFPGGSPETSNGASETITYTEPGEYTVSLTLLGAVGNDTIRTVPVRVFAQPVADATFSVDTSTLAIANLSTDATLHRWDFGDGNSSVVSDPEHTYLATGMYSVVYIATNGPCTDTLRREVTIDVLSDVVDLAELGVRLFPNPTSGRLQLTGPAKITRVFDLSGKSLQVQTSARTLDLSGQPAGSYLVQVEARGKVYSVLVMVR